MILRDLEIEHFGLFSGHRIQFPGGGMQLIFGPNEAGKSTLLQLIRELLFGFQVRNPYVFPDHAGEMAATATMEMSDGSRIRFRRRKGRVKEVVGEDLNKGTSIDKNDLAELLGGAGPELFAHVFGFSLAELTSGEKSLQHANLNEALYGGALGGLAGFQHVLTDIEKEHEQLFSPTATKRPINQLLSTLKNQAKELRSSQVRPRDYERLEQDMAALNRQVDQLRIEREDLQRRESRTVRLAQARDLWIRRTRWLEELATLDVPSEFPRDGETQFDQHRRQRDQLAAELEEFQEELTATEAQLDKLSPQTGLLDQATVIKSLAHQLDKIRGFRQDIGLRRQESQVVKDGVATRLRELDPDWTSEHLDRFRVSLARRSTVDIMQGEIEELRSRRRELRARRPELESDIGAMRERREALSNESPVLPLVELVDATPTYRSNLDKLGEYELQMREVAGRIEAMESKLNAPFGHTLENVGELPVPMSAVVLQFRQRWSEIQSSMASHRSVLDSIRTDIADRRSALETLQARDEVPDRDQLYAARKYRNDGWDLIRRTFIDNVPPTGDELEGWSDDATTSLPDEYEAAVSRADEVADERQAHAEVVARQDQLVDEIARLEKRSGMETEKWNSILNDWELCQADWTALWAPCRIEPDPPEAMFDWLRLYDELLEAVAIRATVQRHIESQKAVIAEFERELRAALSDDAGTTSAHLAEAQRRVEQAREAASEAKSYASQLPRKEQQLATLDTELAAAERECDQWQHRWVALLTEFGFPTSWDVHIAAKVLNGLSAARTEHEKAEALDQRVAAMQEGIDRFEAEVRAACGEVAPQLTDTQAENAVEELGQMVDRAKQDEQECRLLTDQTNKLVSRCNAKKKQLKRAVDAIQVLMDAARVEREADLPDVARHVRRWHELREQIDTVERELNTIRSDEDRQTFETALADADAAELESQQRMLRVDFEQADQKFTEALHAQGVAANRLQQLDHASRAADLAQEMESTRSRLVAAVDRWAPLVLARAFMQQSLRRFEREHQPQMLIDVSRLFQRMTLGRYKEIARKLDERGTLQVRCEDGGVKEPHQLSTGTREQLYLAIRLAYVLHYCRDAEPLPVVMDDVLVNFDDRRAAATLDALVETAEGKQVMLLTCHRGTLELAQSRIPDLEPIVLEL